MEIFNVDRRCDVGRRRVWMRSQNAPRNARFATDDVDGNAGRRTVGGTTDSKGVATLITHGQYKGVPLGKYKVAVSKIIGEGTPPPPSPIDEESARKFKEYQDSGATYEEFYVVDPQYRLVDTTPLEVEVVKGGNKLTVDVGAATHEPIQQSTGVLGR